MWEAADAHHGYQWWQSFGDDFEYLNSIATKILSKPISASACEFSWSDVSGVVTKKTQRLKDDTIEKIINTRAMNKLEASCTRKVLLGNIPKIDDFLDSFVQEAIDNSPTGGDDVEEAEENASESDSDGDEDLDVVAEDEDSLYELGARNEDLEQSALTMF